MAWVGRGGVGVGAAEPGLAQYEIGQGVGAAGVHRAAVTAAAGAGVLVEHREHSDGLGRGHGGEQGGDAVAFGVGHHCAFALSAFPAVFGCGAVLAFDRAGDRGP